MNQGILQIKTSTQKELIDITHMVSTTLNQCSSHTGIFYLFNPHTTAGLTINEGADPDVQTDIITGLSAIVPQLDFKHAEGNSAAHIMTLLTGSSLTMQVEKGQLLLGTWQRVFFCEYDGPRTRSLNWKFLPDL